MTILGALGQLKNALEQDPSIGLDHPASVVARTAISADGLTVSSFRKARGICDKLGIPYTAVTADGLRLGGAK